MYKEKIDFNKLKIKNEIYDINKNPVPAIDMEEYIKNLEKNNMNNFDIQNNSELESNNEIEFGIYCLKFFKDEINLTNDKNEAKIIIYYGSVKEKDGYFFPIWINIT